MSRILATTLFCVTAGVMSAQGAEMNCARDADEAKRACTTVDTEAGTDDRGAEIEELGSRVHRDQERISEIGIGQSSQFKNQQKISERLARVAREKAQACVSAMATCQASCGSSAGFYDKISQVYSRIGDADGEAENFSRASGFSQARESCRGYARNIAQAYAQAAKLDGNAGTNSEGHQETKSDANNGVRGDGKGGGPAGADELYGAGGESSATLAGYERRGRGAGNGEVAGASSFGPSNQALGEGGSWEGGGGGLSFRAPSGGAGSAAEASEIMASHSQQGLSPTARLGSDRALGASRGVVSLSDPASGSAAGASRTQVLQRAAAALARKLGGLESARFRDGVTGATGPSLFEKVSRQYRLQISNLEE